MSNPRELALAEAIKNKMIGIQKSVEIYPHLATLQEKILKMSNREIERVSKLVASRVHSFCMKRKTSGKPLPPKMVNNRVKKELERV